MVDVLPGIPEGGFESSQPSSAPLSYAKVVALVAALLAGCGEDPSSDSSSGEWDSGGTDTGTPPDEVPLNVLGIDGLDDCAPIKAATVTPTGFDTIDLETVFDLTQCTDPQVAGAAWFISEETHGASNITLFPQTVTLADGDTLTFEGGGVVVDHSLKFDVEKPDEDVSLGYTVGVLVAELPYIESQGYRTAVGLGEVDVFCALNAGDSEPTCIATLVQ